MEDGRTVSLDMSAIAVVLLAAGRAERFGGDKLSALLGDRPVLAHVAEMLATLPFGAHFAVIPAGGRPLPGFVCLSPGTIPALQSDSLKCGVEAALNAGADAVLIMLGDMPLVPEDHVRRLVAAFDGDRIASSDHGTLMPPALFGARHFAALLATTGDRGAGHLLQGAPSIALPAHARIDIDTTEDLARARKWVDGQRGDPS